MSTLSHLLHCDGTTDGLTFQRNIALLAFSKAALDLFTLAYFPGLEIITILHAWLNPFLLIAPWLEGSMPWTLCASTLVFFTALVWNGVHRARHAGWPKWTALITCIPYVGALMTVVLAFLPARKHTVWDLI